MVSLGSLKISFLFVATVLIFFTAGLLSLAPRARRLLGAYRIPWRPAFSSHLVSRLTAQVVLDRFQLSGNGANQSLSADSTRGGCEEGQPLVPIIQHYVVIGTRQLTIGGRNQGNNLHVWKICLEPIDHLNRGQSAISSFIVRDRYDVVADAPKQLGPRVQVLFVIPDLKHDLLG